MDLIAEFGSNNPSEPAMSTISTQPVKGMRDILGNQARVKRKIERIIQENALRYGFEPMQVPVLENLDVLLVKGGGGEDAQKELYTLEDQSGRKLGMRFEFTTSLARVLAGNPDLPKPFKALNMGTVYRYDNPQALRYREFTQADCDIVGSTSPLADAECLSLGIDVLLELGVEEFQIRVNDRRITNELISLCGVPEEQAKDCMRSLDKLDKIGIDGVKKELQSKKISTEILSFLKADMKQIKKELEKGKLKLDGIESLEKIMNYLSQQGKLQFVKFDPSLVRGLDYYTGMVLEIDAGVGVSIGSGGRYDQLIRSLGGPQLPAVGISFGVDRVMSLLESKQQEIPVEAYVIPIGKVEGEAFALVGKLREAGFKAEMDIMKRNLSKNLGSVDARKIPLVLFLGEDELAKNQVKVRDMGSGEEKLVELSPFGKLQEYLSSRLGKKS